VALFFTVVHVAALVLATAPADAPLWGHLANWLLFPLLLWW
jgi:hypothetical protein